MKLAEHVIRVRIDLVQHTKLGNMTLMTRRQETLIRIKNGHRIHLVLKKLMVTFNSWPLHWRTIFKDLENKCILQTKLYYITLATFHLLQNTSYITLATHEMPTVHTQTSKYNWGLVRPGDCNDLVFLLHSTSHHHTSVPKTHFTHLKIQILERHEKQYHTHGLRSWACCQTSRQECEGWD